jgi:hypothetical protein
VKDIGGNLGGRALATARWLDGTTVVAGVAADKQVWAARWTPKDHWGPWAVIAPGPARSAPSIVAWGTLAGRLYYTDHGGHVAELGTDDAGKTWT